MSKGYTWLGVGPDKSNVALLEAEKLDIENHLYLIEKGLYTLTNKLNRFHSLCKRYELYAASERGAGILRQLKAVKKEIHELAKDLEKTLNEILAECEHF